MRTMPTMRCQILWYLCFSPQKEPHYDTVPEQEDSRPRYFSSEIFYHCQIMWSHWKTLFLLTLPTLTKTIKTMIMCVDSLEKIWMWNETQGLFQCLLLCFLRFSSGENAPLHWLHWKIFSLGTLWLRDATRGLFQCQIKPQRQLWWLMNHAKCQKWTNAEYSEKPKYNKNDKAKYIYKDKDTLSHSDSIGN